MEQAIATYQWALHILRELGEHAKTGAVLNNMAINFANEGKLDRAEHFYQQAKYHFEQAGQKANAATALGNIADIFYLRGNLPGATKLYKQSLEIQASLAPSQPGYCSTVWRIWSWRKAILKTRTITRRKRWRHSVRIRAATSI